MSLKVEGIEFPPEKVSPERLQNTITPFLCCERSVPQLYSVIPQLVSPWEYLEMEIQFLAGEKKYSAVTFGVLFMNSI